MATNIKGALAKLDVTNDNHWTGDGLPRLDAVKLFASDQTLTREAVTQAHPGFTRANATSGTQVAQGPAAVTPAATPDPAASAAPVAPPAATLPDIAAPVATGVASEPDEIQLIQDELNAEHGRLAEIEKYLADGNKAKQEAQKRIDLLSAKLERAGGVETVTETIQGYLAGQAALRARRADQIKRWNDSGVNLKDILPSKAPIDIAMSRKRGYGTRRPVVPVKV
jgi:hypothetical protein